MSDILNSIGNKIRIIRKSKHLTQEHLAEKAGLQYSYIGGIERGERNVSIKTLEKVANGLEIEVSELFQFGETVYYQDEEKEELVYDISLLLNNKTLEDIRSIKKIIIEINNMTDSN